MNENKSAIEPRNMIDSKAAQNPAPATKIVWETPKLQDVSEEVMAQPYIRFT